MCTCFSRWMLPAHNTLNSLGLSFFSDSITTGDTLYNVTSENTITSNVYKSTWKIIHGIERVNHKICSVQFTYWALEYKSIVRMIKDIWVSPG